MHAFFCLVPGVGAGLRQAGGGELLADVDEFGGQASEALVLVELGLDGGGGGGRQGAGGALAIEVADEFVSRLNRSNESDCPTHPSVRNSGSFDDLA